MPAPDRSAWSNGCASACRIGFFLYGLCLLCGCQAYWSKNYNEQGLKHFQRGDYQQALQAFNQARNANPQEPDSYYNMAAAYHQLAKQDGGKQEFEQAERLYRQCLKLDNNHAPCYRGLAVLLKDRHRDSEAFELLQDWEEQFPANAGPKVELARFLEENLENEPAREYLMQASRLEPNNPRVLSSLGRLHKKAGKLEDALADYERAYRSNPRQPGLREEIIALRKEIRSSSSNSPKKEAPADKTRMVNTPTPAPR